MWLFMYYWIPTNNPSNYLDNDQIWWKWQATSGDPLYFCCGCKRFLRWWTINASQIKYPLTMSKNWKVGVAHLLPPKWWEHSANPKYMTKQKMKINQVYRKLLHHILLFFTCYCYYLPTSYMFISHQPEAKAASILKGNK